MKRLSLVVPFLIVGWLVAAEPADRAAQEEQKKLEGDWEGTTSELGGDKVPDAFFKGTILTIKGDKFTLQFKGKVTNEGTVKIDPKAKTIDLVSTKFGGLTDLGIYELDGDKLRICSARNERPKEFATKKGTFMKLEAYTRKK
jgi:uncharacterized protein (TIGR03067 family)